MTNHCEASLNYFMSRLCWEIYVTITLYIDTALLALIPALVKSLKKTEVVFLLKDNYKSSWSFSNYTSFEKACSHAHHSFLYILTHIHPNSKELRNKAPKKFTRFSFAVYFLLSVISSFSINNISWIPQSLSRQPSSYQLSSLSYLHNTTFELKSFPVEK